MNPAECPADLNAAFAEWLRGQTAALDAHLQFCGACAQGVEKLMRDERFAGQLRSASAAQLDPATAERLLNICERAQREAGIGE